MAFKVRTGVPEMEAVWNDLSSRKQLGQLDKNEAKFFKKLVTGQNRLTLLAYFIA